MRARVHFTPTLSTRVTAEGDTQIEYQNKPWNCVCVGAIIVQVEIHSQGINVFGAVFVSKCFALAAGVHLPVSLRARHRQV